MPSTEIWPTSSDVGREPQGAADGGAQQGQGLAPMVAIPFPNREVEEGAHGGQVIQVIDASCEAVKVLMSESFPI